MYKAAKYDIMSLENKRVFYERVEHMSEYELIKQLERENAKLKEENQKLSETVSWMHDYIWTLVKRRWNSL